MSLKLTDVDLDADFDELIAVQWAAHEDPFQPFFRFFCPVDDGDRETSLRKSSARMLEWHHHDPFARWLKVKDTSTDKIVGGAWYKIYKENPFAHPEEEVADWYPDDSTRDFVSQAIGQMDVPRMKKAARPHVFLNILFTHPDYRRKGIGAMLVQWGIDTAKELGIEFWLNATPIGKPLYEKLGFELVEKNPLAPKTEKPDENWKEMERKYGNIVFWTMWLPKEGFIEEGKTVRPWEKSS